MELKENNNFWLYLYRYYKGDEFIRPESVCPLFWGGLVGLILMITSPVFTIINLSYCTIIRKNMLVENSDKDWTAWGIFWAEKIIIFIYFFCWELSAITLNKFGFESVTGHEFWMFLVGWLVIPIIVISVFLLFVGITYLFKEDNSVKDAVSVPVEFISAKYNKMCPKITWRK